MVAQVCTVITLAGVSGLVPGRLSICYDYKMSSQQQTAPKTNGNSSALLGLTITCLVLSILPLALLNPSITIGILVFDIICLILSISLLIQARKSPEVSRTKYIASLIISIFAAIIASSYLILIPIINHGFESAACSLQTVVDPNECPSDYKLNSAQELKQN